MILIVVIVILILIIIVVNLTSATIVGTCYLCLFAPCALSRASPFPACLVALRPTHPRVTPSSLSSHISPAFLPFLSTTTIMAAAILDSSPIRGATAIPPPTAQSKRGQKRSADEALLLTPPGTVKREHRKRTGKRVVTVSTRTRARTRSGSKAQSKEQQQQQSRSRGSGQESELEASEADADNNNDDNDDSGPSLGDGAHPGRRLEFGRETKRRRTGSLDARLESLLEDPENPFWDGPTKKTSPATDLANKAEKSVRIRSPTPPVVHFKGKEPVSPPPSKKQNLKTGKRTVTLEAVAEEEPQTAVIAAPSTPKKGRKRATSAAAKVVRDSPNNPFLDDDDSPLSVSGEPAEPRTPTAHAEKPTIAYVL